MRHVAYAPGKMIVTGEHFVVHGAHALAAAIGRGVTVRAEVSDRTRIVSKPLGMVTESLDSPPPPLRPLAEALKSTVGLLQEARGVTLQIDSDIPFGSGLGSSSAVAVASVAAASSALDHRLSGEELVELATVSERMVHGNPSGVDVNVAVLGGIILFKKGSPPRKITLDEGLDFVVGVTGVERRTGVMVERFSRVRDVNPHLFESLVSSSSRLGELAAKSLQKRDLETLGSILNFHHAVLSWMGMSTPELDRMVERALKAGSYGAKLTGGGGGGSIIALPFPERAFSVEAALAEAGTAAFTTRTPVEGVRVWREESS